MSAPSTEPQQQAPVYAVTGGAYTSTRPSPIAPVQRPRQAANAKSGAQKRGWKKRLAGKFVSPPALFVFATVIAPSLLLGARHGIVQHMPAAAPLYAAIGLPVNLDGLDLRNVTSVLENGAGGKRLLIKGEIVNLKSRTGKLPNLQMALRGKDGRDLYTWQAPSPQSRIKANATIRFVARLDSPPGGAQDVFVRFAQKGG